MQPVGDLAGMRPGWPSGTGSGPSVILLVSTVSSDGKLTIDTSKITLGPLPVAVGQPGIIPPKSPTGCL